MISTENKTILTDSKEGDEGVIISVIGGEKATKRLADLGLTPGTEITVVRKALFSGPLQIEACNSKLVIGWGLASKIMISLK